MNQKIISDPNLNSEYIAHDSGSPFKKWLLAGLAALVIIVLMVVIGLGMAHHQDTMEHQMRANGPWTMKMMYMGRDVYKQDPTFTVQDATTAHMTEGTGKINCPIKFIGKKEMMIGNHAHGELLQLTSSSHSYDDMKVDRVYSHGFSHKLTKPAKYLSFMFTNK